MGGFCVRIIIIEFLKMLRADSFLIFALIFTTESTVMERLREAELSLRLLEYLGDDTRALARLAMASSQPVPTELRIAYEYRFAGIDTECCYDNEYNRQHHAMLERMNIDLLDQAVDLIAIKTELFEKMLKNHYPDIVT